MASKRRLNKVSLQFAITRRSAKEVEVPEELMNAVDGASKGCLVFSPWSAVMTTLPQQMRVTLTVPLFL